LRARARGVKSWSDGGPRGRRRQITPRVLLDATTSPDTAAAKRAFEAMMPMKKIDVAAIEAAL
jgi:hypothetical protein